MYLNPKPTTREASVYLFRWKNKDRKELEPVQWESQWKSHPFDERRGSRRKNNRRHFIPRDDFFVLLKDERAGPKRTHQQCANCGKMFWEQQAYKRHGTTEDPCPSERRNRLRCELCRQSFDDRFALYAHLPCRATSEMVSEGLADRIQDMRSRDGVLRSQEKKDFCELLDASLSETVFKLACESGDFRRRNEESKEQKFQRFRTGMFYQFLACIRPELIHSKSPTSGQPKEVGRIQREYFRSPSPRQETILCELFFGLSLAEMAKRETPGRPPSTLSEHPEVKHILEQYEGEKAIAELKAFGVDVPTGKEKYALLRKLRNYWEVRSKRRVTSSRNKH
jgi:hypothetical protein